MVINTFKKLKNGQYELFFCEGGSLIIHEDLILKYELLLHKEISEDRLNQIRLENVKYDAYNLALKYLKKSMHSCYEVDSYLDKKGIDLVNREFVITKLQEQGYLNDLIYAKAYFHDQVHMSYNGPQKIANDLSQHGVSSQIISDVLSQFDRGMIVERIQIVIRKLEKTNRSKSNILLKKQMLEHLIRLGYDRSDILGEIEKVQSNDEDFYQKEYNKIYQRLSRKYSGEDLQRRVQQKMYQKGFRING